MYKYLPLTLLFFAVFSYASSAKTTTEKLPIEYFFKKSDLFSLKISPTGEYFAAKLNIDGKARLAILRHQDLKLMYLFQFKSGDREVGDYGWLNDERIYAFMETKVGPLDKPAYTGYMFAGNVDGSKKVQLSPGKAFLFSDREFLDMLDDDPRHILITRDTSSRSYVSRLNVYTGRIKDMVKSPTPSGSFIIDHNKQARLAFAWDKEYHSQSIYYRDGDDTGWGLFDKRDEADGKFYPFGTLKNNSFDIYIEKGPQGKGLYSYDTTTKNLTMFYKIHGEYDIEKGIINEDDDVIGILRQTDKLNVELFDNKAKNSKFYRSLTASFPEQVVVIDSWTKDKNKYIIKTYSDRHPTNFYLFNKSTRNLELLLNVKNWVNPTLMAKMEPISFTARDGLKIDGFLTRPKNAKTNLPMVVYVHGGPYGIKDEWRYDSRVQFMANRGYAVLQINYRGSGGRGTDFELKAYRMMGAEMQDDLTDGTLWAIEQGIANKDRICIFGASYGGYAAMMAVVKEPDLYKCAIPYVGVYDIAIQKDESDTADYANGRKFLAKAWNAYDEEFVKQRSPIYHLDKLKASLFLVHGEEDPRCPIEQYEALTEALDERGIEYESMVKEHEGHGFYDLDNVFELHQRLEKFLNKHIGQN